MKILTVDQMRRADENTMKTLPPLTLMERAGKEIFEEAKKHGDDFLIVVGSGNNGGDGYVTARYLLEAGYSVAVLPISEPKTEDSKAMAEKYRGEVLGMFPRRRYPVIIDCLFGVGLTRNLEGKYLEAVEFINRMGAYVISADIPSGLNADNGKIMGACVQANKTVAIAYLKRGHVMNDGFDVCGEVVVKDIGIYTEEGIESLDSINEFFPKRKRNVHKGTFGKATLIAGSYAYSGAGLLALSALMKMGVGYPELKTRREVLPYYIGKFPEALLSEFGNREGLLSARSIGIGCGLTVSSDVYAEICYLLERYEGTLVIDADGLNSLAKFGVQILKEKKCKVIVTPHPKEFTRLGGTPTVEGAEEFAREYGVTVLLKGASSVITDGVTTYLNITGSPCLAKGGSGDVLTGLITGLASRLSPLDSARVGAYLLGKAGEIAEEKHGVYSATATDVLAEISTLTAE